MSDCVEQFATALAAYKTARDRRQRGKGNNSRYELRFAHEGESAARDALLSVLEMCGDDVVKLARNTKI